MQIKGSQVQFSTSSTRPKSQNPRNKSSIPVIGKRRKYDRNGKLRVMTKYDAKKRTDYQNHLKHNDKEVEEEAESEREQTPEQLDDYASDDDAAELHSRSVSPEDREAVDEPSAEDFTLEDEDPKPSLTSPETKTKQKVSATYEDEDFVRGIHHLPNWVTETKKSGLQTVLQERFAHRYPIARWRRQKCGPPTYDANHFPNVF